MTTIVHTRPLEAALENYLFNKVRALGGMAIKLAPTAKGIPDRLIILPFNRLYLVELKATGGAVSPIQKHWHERVGEMGVDVHVLVGRAAIDEWLREQVQKYDPLPGKRGRKPGSQNKPKPAGPEHEQQLAPAGTTVDTIGD